MIGIEFRMYYDLGYREYCILYYYYIIYYTLKWLQAHWHYIINWRDATHFDSEGDYRTGCRNVSHFQQQQSYSGLSSPGRSNSTYLWNDHWVQTFQRRTLRFKKVQRKCSCIRRQIMPTRNNNRKKIIMCVTTSHPEKSSKNHIKQLTTLQSIIYLPEEKFLGTSSIWYEVIVVCCLLSPFLHSEAISPTRNTRARNLRKIPTHIHFTSLTAEI